MNIEATAKAYENDYAYAPVGLFVLPLWIGSVSLGGFAFILNWYVAKGWGPYIIDGQRSWFKQDSAGVVDAALAMLLLIVLSVLLGSVGRAMTLKKQSIDGLWKLAIFGIPGICLLFGAVLAFVYRG
jgi:hypothetical protein